LNWSGRWVLGCEMDADGVTSDHIRGINRST
jgi:hypothetical protein